jgi:hypothetical protein
MSLSALFLGFALAAPPAVPAPQVSVGQPALQFVLPALNAGVANKVVKRGDIALTDFVGVEPGVPARGVVLTFLRRDEGEATLGALERVHRKVGRKGIRVLAILCGEADLASASGWVEGKKVGFPVLRDGFGIVQSRYGVPAWPFTVVIDAEGRIESLGVAGDTLEADLLAVLAPWLQ